MDRYTKICLAHIVAVSLSGLAQRSSNDLKAELERLHSQWFTAFDKGDGATMDRMEVPNLVLVNYDGHGLICRSTVLALVRRSQHARQQLYLHGL